MLESALFHQQEASSILHDAYTPVRKEHLGLQMEEAAAGEKGLDAIGSYVVSEDS